MNTIGCHTSRAEMPRLVADLGLEVFQFFVGSPRGWRSASIPDKEVAALQAFTPELFIHAPYLVNPASFNPEVRAKSIVKLNEQLHEASRIGASGVIVHGGQAGVGSDVDRAVRWWAESLAQLELAAPLLIENTAGGSAAPAKTLEGFEKLWQVAGAYPELGYCVDTCHAWTGGFGLVGLHPKLVAITGQGPRLVHLNASTDPFGSGRDHHANLDETSEQTLLSIEYAHQTGAPVVLETPGTNFAGDVAVLKKFLK